MTKSKNIPRINGRVTHCYIGHEMTEENSIWFKNGKYLKRRCKTCHNISARRNYKLRKGKHERIGKLKLKCWRGHDDAWKVFEYRGRKRRRCTKCNLINGKEYYWRQKRAKEKKVATRQQAELARS